MKINYKILAVLVLFLFSCCESRCFAEGDKHMLTSNFNKNWFNAIISIETVDEKGNVLPKGTGFLIQAKDKNSILITASHVVRDENGKVYDNLQYRRSDIEDAEAVITEDELLHGNAGKWFFSASQDLACRFFGWRTGKKELTVLPIDTILQVEDLQPGAPLLILGFPTGLRADFYQKPLARRGMVARAEKDKIIVETFVYPGNSGGPVIYVPSLKVGGPISSPFVNEERLVGVIGSYIPYQEVAISQQTRRPRIVFEENSGLSEVIPANEIINLISRDDVKKQGEEFIVKQKAAKTGQM